MTGSFPAPDPEERTLLGLEVLAAATQRREAERELLEMGITPGLADIESWLTATPRDRRTFAKSWAVFQAAYFLPGETRSR